ncbi:MAG: helix-turn-helix transcriptional regulator [Flavobacterium sp.]
MDKLSFLNAIACMAIFVSLLLSFFLLTVKTKNKLANRLFAAFLILTAIDLSGFFIYDISDSLNLEVFRWTACLLIMPLFYLYALAVCYVDFRLQLKHLLHIIPFVVLNLVLTPRFYLAEAVDKLRFFDSHNQMPEMCFLRILIEAQYFFYIIIVFLVLKKYKEIYLENYANASASTYKWLFQMTVVFLTAHAIVICRNLLRYTGYDGMFLWANVVVGIVALLITCWFVLKALNYPELFKGVNSKLQLTKDILHVSETGISEKVKVQDDAITQQIILLKDYMAKNEPYLDPSLTIQELANQINMQARDLSVLINHHMDQHFFDFVNEYRIQKAMNILRNPSKKDLTILEILYEVGFNSKSSFNTSFKKYTQKTPTAYRNNS